MKLHSFRVNNFRRLKNTFIDLESDISIFVGANNSGKTSATQAIELFVNGSRDSFSVYDFSAHTWGVFNTIGENGITEENKMLPSIHIDLWLEVEKSDLYTVLDLLPSIEWSGSYVGIRIAFQSKDTDLLLEEYKALRTKKATASSAESDNEFYKPWPNDLMSFLDKELSTHYEFAYYALDRAHFDKNFEQSDNFIAMRLLPERGRTLIKSLLRVDCLNAQRHLSDVNSHARAENLSKCLSRFYKRNLEKREDDHSTLKALAFSEQQLNDHLARVFKNTLQRLSELGYPGFANPHLIIKSALNPATIMTQDTRVHYSLDGSKDALTLPDNYNGLGFKNLIYMVVEILDLQARWIEDEDNRSLLHLIFIEEPEAHLHAQLQQVFIRKVLGLLEIEGDDTTTFRSQMVVTTHSPHILYERGFKPIRYFRRKGLAGTAQASECLNLSVFYNDEVKDRDFLSKYLKLTHCDLFFADGVILVEGNVERLLLPIMIRNVSSILQSSYLSVLEVGGAFAHRFKSLIEFLGVPTLIITDIDSVKPSTVIADIDSENEEEDPEEDDEADGSTCLVNEPGALTSNQTLIKWLPKKKTIEDLLKATVDERTQLPTKTSDAIIHVAYQTPQPITINEVSENLTGRTLEEAFGLENTKLCQDKTKRKIGLRFSKQPATPTELAQRLHKRITGNFNKTEFALNILMEDEKNWVTPAYIKEGLLWLEKQINILSEKEVEVLVEPKEQKV